MGQPGCPRRGPGCQFQPEASRPPAPVAGSGRVSIIRRFLRAAGPHPHPRATSPPSTFGAPPSPPQTSPGSVCWVSGSMQELRVTGKGASGSTGTAALVASEYLPFFSSPPPPLRAFRPFFHTDVNGTSTEQLTTNLNSPTRIREALVSLRAHLTMGYFSNA